MSRNFILNVSEKLIKAVAESVPRQHMLKEIMFHTTNRSYLVQHP